MVALNKYENRMVKRMAKPMLQLAKWFLSTSKSSAMGKAPDGTIVVMLKVPTFEALAVICKDADALLHELATEIREGHIQ